MQPHDFVNDTEQLSWAIQKDTKKKAEQALNDQILGIQIMHLQLQQVSAKSNPCRTR